MLKNFTPHAQLEACEMCAPKFRFLCSPVQLIPASLVKAYPRAMLNIHPGLLPAFGGKGMYGERVHKAVIASGSRYAVCGVHAGGWACIGVGVQAGPPGRTTPLSRLGCR